ncbi:MAG: hypothetical protein ACON47_00450 [Flavobacteriaceae bacterium]
MKFSWLVFFVLFIFVGGLHNVLYAAVTPVIESPNLWYSYALQGGLGILSLWVLNQTAQRFPQSVAYAFLTMSLLKIGIYFLFFHPYLKADGELSTIDKLDVLVPYFTALLMETYLGALRLNKI